MTAAGTDFSPNGAIGSRIHALEPSPSKKNGVSGLPSL